MGSRRQTHVPSRGRLAMSAALALTTAATAGLLAVAAQSSPTPVDQHTLTALNAATLPNGEAVPPVVVRVGAENVTGVQYARQVSFLLTAGKDVRGQPYTEASAKRAALRLVIRQAVLTDRAQAEGISVSDEEVAEYVRGQQAARAQAVTHDVAFRTQVNTMEAAAGAASDREYNMSARDAEIYHQLLLNAKLVARHVTLPASSDAIDSYVQQVVAGEQVVSFVPERP